MSLVGCGSDDETPGDPTEVENDSDVDDLPEGDFVDPALVTDDDDNDDGNTDDPGEAPGEAPPEGD